MFARDRASSAFVKVGRASEDAGKKVRSLNGAFGAVTAGSRGLRTSFGLIGKGAALAAGAAGIGGFIAGIKGVYEEGREAQKVGAQTAAVLKSTGGVAKISAAQVGDLATAISDKVGVDDEAIQSGENLLLTFKGVRNEAGKGNDIFNQASRTITDMAAAMNQGKVTTDGLKTSSIQVGKALNDPIKGITALTKVGVTFTDGQKKQITSLVDHGKKLEAQKIILKELNSEFAGSAAAGTTASQKLGVVFGNIKESIGTALLPAIDSVSTWAAKVLPGALQTASSIAGPIFKTLGDGFSGLAAAFSGEGITSDGFVGVMERIGNAGRVALTWLQDTFLPGVVQVFTDLKTKVEQNLPSIDLSGLAATFTEQASKWAGSIIAGIKTGLDTGDWSGLGKTVGTGIVSAIGAAGSFVGKIAGKIGELLSKVDWVGIGLAVGKQIPSLLVGIAAGILNFDLMGLLKGLAKHWQEILLAVLALAFTPAKIVGKVGELLARIPLVGKLLEWGLNAMKRFADNMVGAVFNALKFLGRSFLEGFRRVFPGIGENFLAHLRNLPTYIGVVTLEVIEKAKLMLRRLGQAIAGGIGGVVAKIGELIGKMLKPFANAAGWLVRRGVEFVAGLGRGIAGRVGSLVSGVGRLITAMLRPFLNAARWLISAGRSVISGLWDGISGRWTAVATWFGQMGARVKGWFARASLWLANAGLDIIGGLFSGIRSAMRVVGRILSDVKDAIVGGLKRLFHIASPSRVMMPIGSAIITGLIKGMLTNSGALAQTVKSIGGTVTGLFGDALGGTQSTSSGAMQKMVQGYASMLYGWTGAQWTALKALLMGESGFNPNAQNPTSSAYGLFQFLDSTWGFVGAQKTSNPQGQTLAGLRYIAQVYGTPVNAFSAWLNRTPHWYGSGLEPTVFSRPTLIGVGERGPETVTVTPRRRATANRGVGPMDLSPETIRALGETMGQVVLRGLSTSNALVGRTADLLVRGG